MAFRSLFARTETGDVIFNPAAMTDMGIPKPNAVYSICGQWFALRGGIEYGPFATAGQAKDAE